MHCSPVFLAVAALVLLASARLSCRDMNDKPVDWFAMVKVPQTSGNSDPLIQAGSAYAYSDANAPASVWVLGDDPIDSTKGALYHTLKGLYTSSKTDSAFVIYNDQGATNKSCPESLEEEPEWDSVQYGHMKGTLQTDGTGGYWLVHSVPHFPQPSENPYCYPKTGHRFGQNFMCVSLDTADFDSVGFQLQMTRPSIYDSHISEELAKKLPNLKKAIDKHYIADKPDSSIAKFTVSSGLQFVHLAKNALFGMLYEDLVSPYWKSDLLVQTWRPEDSYCRPKYTWDNENTELFTWKPRPQYASEGAYEFTASNDHSKWCTATGSAAKTREVVCFGDINRAETQHRRGGGQMCFVQKELFAAMNAIVKEREGCSS